MSKRKPITVEEYLENDEMCIAVVKKKYLTRPDQPISECFDNVITNICNVSTESDEVSKQAFIDETYQDWIHGIWKGAGSIMSSANEIGRNVSTMNCSGVVIQEDTIESILEARSVATKMAAHRQGFGVHFDVIRPKGAPINNSAEVSEGAVHWMKSFDRIGYDAGQKARMPAMLFSLSVNHLDVEELIITKRDLNEINNANISIHVTDAFMECVKADGIWHQEFVLKDGTKIEKEVNARYLFKMICDNAWHNGEPGIQFIDRMRSWAIQTAFGYVIEVTNACGEKPIPDQSVCCLAPMNMVKVPNPFTEHNKFHSFMERVVSNMVRFMDNVIQFEIDHSHKSPSAKQKAVVQDLREIGLGIVNLHAWFYENGIVYDSEDAIKITEEFFKYYQYYAFKASVELAKQRGPCPAWTRCKNNGTLEKLISPFLEALFTEFPELRELYIQYGIRNGALLSIAPTGSISMTFPDFISTGIESMMGYAFWRKTRALTNGASWDYFFVLPNMVRKIALSQITNDEDYDFIKSVPASQLDNDGTLGIKVMEIIKKYVNVKLLKPAHEINPFMKIKLMGACQKWIDAAISVTYNLPNDYPIEDVHRIYEAAFDEGLKSITVYRDGSREGIYIFDDPITYQAKFAENNSSTLCTKRPDNIEFHCAPKRPKSLDCEIHHCQIKGDKWIVLVGMFNGLPYEIFAGMKNEDFNISKNIKNGRLIKGKEGMYSLAIPFNKAEITYDGITDLFMNTEYKAVTRLLSLSLRHGVHYDFIIDQLKKSSDYISDFVSVVSRVLNKYTKLIIPISGKNKECPECGAFLVNDAGCLKCPECTYSRCG